MTYKQRTNQFRRILILSYQSLLFYGNLQMPGSKVVSHDVLAHKWLKDLMPRPEMRIKVRCIPHDIRMSGRIVGARSTEQSVWHHLSTTQME